MALIKCPECSAEISEHAKSCPHCGYPIDNNQNENLQTDNQQMHMNLYNYSSEQTEEVFDESEKNDIIETTTQENKEFSVKKNAIVAINLSATIVFSFVGFIVGIVAIFRAIKIKKQYSLASVKKVKGFILAIISVILSVVLMLSVLFGFVIWYSNHQHQYGDWTVIKNASCTEEGTRTRECSICHFVETEQIAKTNHNWESATCTEPKRCKECNLTSGEPLGHSWGKATCTECKRCLICGKEEGKALGHDIADYKCKRCGEFFVEASDIPNIIDVTNPKFHVNSVGGIDVYLTITNKNHKTLKYATFEVEFYNAVGDVLQNQIGHSTSARLKETGPLSEGETDTDVFWEACFYNSTFDGSMRIKTVNLEYTDGTKIDLKDEIANNVVVNWR